MKRLINLPGAKAWLAAALVMVYLLPLVVTEGIAAAYLKFDGVDGECKDPAHDKWIDVSSIQFGAGRAITGAGSTRNVGPATHQDVKVTKWIDKSTPILMESVCKGKVYPKVEIEVTAAGYDPTSSNTTYLTYVLENVIISSYSTGGVGGDTVPTEELSLNFTKIEYSYSSQNNNTGEVEFSTNVTCVVEDR